MILISIQYYKWVPFYSEVMFASNQHWKLDLAIDGHGLLIEKLTCEGRVDALVDIFVWKYSFWY